jgi:nicotinamidase-related amidase
MGISENNVKVIDSQMNRIAIKDNLRARYCTKINIQNGSPIYDYICGVIERELKDKSLYELLQISVDNIDALVWGNIFDYIKKSVSKKIKGAENFFRIGEQATLNSDKWWDEYHTMLGFIPCNTCELVGAYINFEDEDGEYDKIVENICGYLKTFLPQRFKWVAFSDDGAYEDKSEGTFDSEKDCYNDMRRAVLEKMKWNTEFDDDLVPEDGVDNFVGYVVKFSQNMIIHQSFSGVYVYKIVDENTEVTHDDIFTDDFKKWLRNYLQVEIY